MLPTKDEIKLWLKTSNRSREWLGQQCGKISKKTVDNWLSSPQEIPVGTLALIGRLMEDDRAAEEDRKRKEQPQNQLFSVEVDLETFRTYSKAALAAGQTLEEWVIDTCDDEVARILKGNVVSITSASAPEKDADYWIDLMGGIAAGSPISSHVAEEPIPVGKQYPDDHYALKVFGESMAPKIPDGSTIIVRRWQDQGFPRKGTIVVYNDARGATLKEFGYRVAKPGEEANAFGKVPTLRSLNPAFPEVETLEGGRIDAVFVEVSL